MAIEDGQRIVLGGLIDKTETKIRKQIPVLGSIPLLKYLFSYTKNTQVTKEMVIILSPKIMNPQAIEQLQDEIPQIPAYEDSSLPLSNTQPAPNIRDLTLSSITDSHTLNNVSL